MSPTMSATYSRPTFSTLPIQICSRRWRNTTYLAWKWKLRGCMQSPRNMAPKRWARGPLVPYFLLAFFATMTMAGLETTFPLLVRDVLVLVDREEGARERLKGRGYNLNSILGLEAMLNYLMASEKIEEQWYRKSIDYLKQGRSERGVE